VGPANKKKKKIKFFFSLKTLGQVSTFLQEPKTLKKCDVLGSDFFFGGKRSCEFSIKS
jgi:hypothetical protein